MCRDNIEARLYKDPDWAIDEIEQLRAKLEDAELLAERRKWGAQEMDRLRAKLAKAEEDKARLVGRLKEVLDAATGTIDPMMGAVPTSVLEKVRAAIDGAKEE